MTFRPYPGFTIFCAIMFAVLCGLGVWQVQRLHWKLDLIEKIQAGLSAKPIPLDWPVGIDGDEAEWEANDDYRKVVIRGHFLHNSEVYFFTTGAEGMPSYHVLTPFVMDRALKYGDALDLQSNQILVDRGLVPQPSTDSAERSAGNVEGEVSLVGILRRPDAPNFFTPKPDLTRRIVYTRYPGFIGATFGLGSFFPMFIEADATPNPGGWPKGGQTVVDLPNNHLSYAITWFGLAICLLGVWLAYHIQKGRLAWRKS